VISNVTSSVTVTPVSLPTQPTMTSHSSLKGIVLPTHPLPPEQALGEDLVPMLLNFFLRHWQNKQECLSLASIFSLGPVFLKV
jgi:hypothetical protein